MLLLAACAIVATIMLVSYPPRILARELLKVCYQSQSSCQCSASRSFKNQIWAAILELCLLNVTDPRADHQPYVNLPTIASGNTDSPLCYVGIASPYPNKKAHSAGLRWWLWDWGSFEHSWLHPMKSSWRSCLISPSTKFLLPRDWKRRADGCRKDHDQEEFQGEWTAPAPKLH